MSKYIIEIEDEPYVRRGENALYRAKGFNSLVFDKNGLGKLTPLNKELEEAYQKGFEVGQHEATTFEYQRGLDDAWDAAKKICTNWMISDKTLAEIFGQGKDIDTIMHENTASEAIAKLKAYEERQKPDEIKVGNWVFNKHVGITSSAKVTCVEGQKVYMLCDDGSCGFADMTDLKKTNVPNPKIEQLLEILKGEPRNCSTCWYDDGNGVPQCTGCSASKGYNMWKPKEGAE